MCFSLFLEFKLIKDSSWKIYHENHLQKKRTRKTPSQHQTPILHASPTQAMISLVCVRVRLSSLYKHALPSVGKGFPHVQLAFSSKKGFRECRCSFLHMRLPVHMGKLPNIMALSLVATFLGWKALFLSQVMIRTSLTCCHVILQAHEVPLET